jgi:hypothetical protein
VPDTTATVRTLSGLRRSASLASGFLARLETVSWTLATLKPYLPEQSRPLAQPSKFAAHLSQSWPPFAPIHCDGKPAPYPFEGPNSREDATNENGPHG